MSNRHAFAWVLALIAILSLNLGATAQEEGHEAHHPEGDEKASTPAEAAPGEMCHMMQDRMEEMQKKHGEMQSKMESCLMAMNEASGDDRLEKAVAALNEMATQQQAMHEMHTHMMDGMMKHMAEHMEKGMSPAAKKEMMKCPMMGGMKEGMMKGGMMKDDKAGAVAPAPSGEDSEEDHSAHH